MKTYTTSAEFKKDRAHEPGAEYRSGDRQWRNVMLSDVPKAYWESHAEAFCVSTKEVPGFYFYAGPPVEPRGVVTRSSKSHCVVAIPLEFFGPTFNEWGEIAP